MKYLVAIQSCWAHRDRHQVMRDTWLKDLPPEVDYQFFLGRPLKNLEPIRFDKDETCLLEAPDDYDNLSVKTKLMCGYAHALYYDYMFKCDTDTLVNVRNLMYFEFALMRRVYLGGENEDDTPANLQPAYNLNDGISYPPRTQFCSGGAGYWLDKQCLQLVAEYASIPTAAEDVYVAKILRDANITPKFSPYYQWRPGAVLDHNTVSYHLSSVLQKKYESEQMREYYQRMKEL